MKDINYKNKDQRIKLYELTFMKQSAESRVITLNRELLNTSLATSGVLNDSTRTLLELAEAIADLEIITEVVKLSILNLSEAVSELKNKKLNSMNRRLQKKDSKIVVALENENLFDTIKNITGYSCVESETDEINEAISALNKKAVFDFRDNLLNGYDDSCTILELLGTDDTINDILNNSEPTLP